jgi:glycerol-3-phosphate acyltransferase PlsY/phosphohistidine swiveling domain-containing protein
MNMFELHLLIPAGIWGWKTALFVIAFFVYGSIPFTYIFTLLFSRKKLTQTGTGNIGVASAFGTGGLAAGFLAVAGEASKGILPIYVSRLYYDGALVTSLLFITAAIIGYGYSFFLKGRGGQGGTIFLWALLFLSPYTFLAYFFGTILIYPIIRRRRLATAIGFALLPLEIFLITHDLAFMIFGVVMALYYVLRYNPQTSEYRHYQSSMKLLRFFEKILGEKHCLFIPLDRINKASQAGFKAYNLSWLKKNGMNVPEAWVCPYSVFQRYNAGDLSVLDEIRNNLRAITKAGTLYSVRSSANLEDGATNSFAGQFMSFLNLKDVEEMVKAISKVWESIRSEHLTTYLKTIQKNQDEIQIAVIVQEMVDARFSGVVFTKNPISGFDEIIVETIPGQGDRFNNGYTDPVRWVYKWGNWLKRPDSTDLPEEVISEIVKKSHDIAKKYHQALDIEWAYDGQSLHWLQLRPITTLRGLNIYSNKISKEFLPGMIKPLVWSVNIPVVNSSWKKLLVEIIGKKAGKIEISSLAKSVYYRAYFNMGIIGDIFELLGMPRELLELLLGLEVDKENGPRFHPGLKSIIYLPRLALLMVHLLLFGSLINKYLKKYTVLYHDIASSIDSLHDENEILVSIDTLVAASKQASYYVIVTTILMGLYTRLFKTWSKRHDLQITKSARNAVRTRISDIDPGYYLSHLHDLFQALSESEKKLIQDGDKTQIGKSGLYKELQIEIGKFSEKFGHLTESGNDFSLPQWKESPEFIMKMIVNTRIVPPVSEHDGDSPDFIRLQRSLIGRFLDQRSLQYQEYRERVNFLYTYGYSLFRNHFLKIGSFWKEKGYVGQPEEIFFLTHGEITDFQQNQLPVDKIADKIVQRKQEMHRLQNILLPPVIVGDSLPPKITGDKISKILRGVPASKGYCTGKTAVVRSLEQYHQSKEIEILVIPYSDVSWTPLFPGVKGIISESGGMLSHCSIIAREFGIPAVVSVHNALQIPDGTLVAIDGDKGEVLLMDQLL